jgi:hypothetical protein
MPTVEMPPFTEVFFRSVEAYKKYNNMLPRIDWVGHLAEFKMIGRLGRRCNVIHITPENIHRDLEPVIKMGLKYKLFDTVKRYEGFAHRHEKPQDINEAMYFGAACISEEDVLRFERAYFQGDHDIQGELLGYPRCCRKAFMERWGRGELDQVLSPAIETEGYRSNTVRVDPIMDISMRYAGVRILNFFPHSYSCKEAFKYAEEMLRAMMEIDVKATIAALELLSKPHTWSQVNGIIEVDSPDIIIVAGGYKSEPEYVVIYPSRTVRDILGSLDGVPRDR